MKRYLSLVAFVLIVLIGYGIVRDYLADENRRPNPEYQEYIDSFTLKLKEASAESLKKSWAGSRDIQYRGGGTTGNFEGPQVYIAFLKFFNQYFEKEDGNRMQFFDGNTLNFDPDHPYYGLPNVIAKVSPVRLFDAEKANLKSLLQSISGTSTPQPYKTYKKRIIPTDTGLVIREFEMQLWLTEFNVTVDILPERKAPPIPVSSLEKDTTVYPGKWYGSSRKFVKLSELREEWKNNRYGDLSLILKIIPDNSPWYYKTEDGINAVPAIGVGAVYCSGLKIVNESDERRVSPNIQKGSVLYLHPDYKPEEKNVQKGTVQRDMNLMVSEFLNAQKEPVSVGMADSFWNKPYFIRLYFNNIGSWREGFLGNRKFDDQVTFTFLMPVFVLGSWDIIPPSDIIPEWDPPKPYFREFSLKNLIPAWGLGTFGKFLSLIGLIVIVLIILRVLFPVLGSLRKVLRLK
jgi:hypothetical protein